MTESAPLPFLRHNPFATRFTRPGVLPPLDTAGLPLDLDELLDTLVVLGGSGSIEGPHGHGKTTVLLALAGRAGQRGLAAVVLRVRSIFDVAGICRNLARVPVGSTLFIDGWESLGRLPGCLIRLFAATRSCHLVVTSHGPSGLPLLMRCRTSPHVLATILVHLPDPGAVIEPHDVDDAFERHAGNLRECLYDLYDRFERRSRSRVSR